MSFRVLSLEIEPNCEKLHAIGVRESYTYFIDGDGTGESSDREYLDMLCKSE